jgi:hypothetical protein
MKKTKRHLPPPGSGTKGKRPPAVEIDRRVMLVYRLICAGIRRGDDIAEYVRQMNRKLPEDWIPFRVNRSTIFIYLKRARAMLVEVGKVDAEEQRGELIEQAYEIYRAAKAAGHHSAAAMALREIARLRGLSTENFTGSMLLSYKIIPRKKEGDESHA